MIEFRDTAEMLGVIAPSPWPDARPWLDYWSDVTSLAWADLNGDGRDDLMLAPHLQFTRETDSPPLLFLNGGDGFSEIGSRFEPGTFPRVDRHGRTWFDADNDGDPDYVVISGGEGANGSFSGSPNQFYRNVDGGRDFREVAGDDFQNMPARGRTATPIDVNDDGLLDLVQFNLVSRPGATATETIQLFVNDGDGFVDRTAGSGLQSALDTTFGQTADLNGDGTLELLVHGERAFQAIYGPSGSGFVDVTGDFAPPALPGATDVAIADFDGDLGLEAYVGRTGTEAHGDVVLVGPNDVSLRLAEVDGLDGDFTLETDGRAGTLEFGITVEGDRTVLQLDEVWLGAEVTPVSGADAVEHSSGCSCGCCVVDSSLIVQLATADPRVAGLPEAADRVTEGLYVGYDAEAGAWSLVWNRAGESVNLFARALGGMSFTGVDTNDSVLASGLPDQLFDLGPDGRLQDVTEAAGLTGVHSTRSVGAGDFDNDMDVDLYLSLASPVRNLPNILLENQGDGQFVERSTLGGGPGGPLGWTAYGGFDVPVRAAVADFDDDGFLDIAIQNTAISTWAPFLEASPIHLLQGVPNENHWLKVDLEGVVLDRDALGARVYVTADEVVQLREQGLGIHLFSQDSKTLHFGLGDHDTATAVEVVWRSGLTQTLFDVAADRTLRIVEGLGSNADDRFEAMATRAMTIDARRGDDVVLGGSGEDRLNGGRGADRIRGGPGDDIVAGGRARDQLHGNRGDDLLAGGKAADQLVGGRGADQLMGGSGADILDGGGGPDRLWGELGADRFVLGVSDAEVDRIEDFRPAEGDVIDLQAVLGIDGAPEQRLDDLVRLVPDGDDAILRVDPDATGAQHDFVTVALLVGGVEATVAQLVEGGHLLL